MTANRAWTEDLTYEERADMASRAAQAPERCDLNHLALDARIAEGFTRGYAGYTEAYVTHQAHKLGYHQPELPDWARSSCDRADYRTMSAAEVLGDIRERLAIALGVLMAGEDIASGRIAA